MSKNDDHIIRFAKGREFNFGKAENKALRWDQFKDLSKKPPDLAKRLREYNNLSVAQQTALKAINGWV